MLDVYLKLSALTDWAAFQVVMLFELVILGVVQVKLYGVVPCRDSLHIKVDELVGLDGLDEVNVDDDEQVDEHGQTAGEQSPEHP